MFDAVGASGRAAAAGDDEGKRSLDVGHAVLLQGQKFVHGDGHVVEVGNERTRRVQDDFAALAPGNALDAVHVDRAVCIQRRLVGGVGLFEHLLDVRRALVEFAFEVVEQIADGEVRFADQGKIEAGVGAHRLDRDGGDVRAEGNGLCAAGVRQETTIHVVFEGGRGQLSHVIFGLVFVEQFGEFGPAHTFGVAVHHFDFIDGMQERRHLRQRNLGPDHVLAGAASNAVLGANPESAVGGGRVDEHDVHRIGGAGRGEKSVADDGVGIGEIHHAQFGGQAAAHVDGLGVIRCHNILSFLH